ncbi:MAG: hypothetical protein K2X98_05440 [Alphaproteobacteria bacterium]|nr:hypothetical protein [Alphaproteobacteria bacterium]
MIPQSLLFSCVLVISCLLDIIFFTHYACCLVLMLHLTVFRLNRDPSIFLMIGLGFLEDLYGNHLFGVTSFYLILMLRFLRSMNLWTQKLDNFWFIWLSYIVFSFMYIAVDNMNLVMQHNHNIVSVGFTTVILPFFLIAVYPLLFKILKPFAHHVRS